MRRATLITVGYFTSTIGELPVSYRRYGFFIGHVSLRIFRGYLKRRSPAAAIYRNTVSRARRPRFPSDDSQCQNISSITISDYRHGYTRDAHFRAMREPDAQLVAGRGAIVLPRKQRPIAINWYASTKIAGGRCRQAVERRCSGFALNFIP